MTQPDGTYETLLVERRGRVGLITLNRPKVLNALNAALAAELTAVLAAFDRDAALGCTVITGSEKAFAAGADITEMAGKTYPQARIEDFIAVWDGFARLRKPVIAAVGGFALGGGCELAMMCDLIIAADGARFGQPEIRLGIVPGIGGTQRLVRAIGKAKAMEMVLTGRMMDAAEAERAGLVARVVPAADLLAEAMRTAEAIAAMPLPAVLAAKDCVDRAYELTLAEGIRYERQAFYALFASADQKEGMAAFLEKRPPAFRHG
ncbi:enoyl-CoA hydratase [Labrys monachus]|uniref:Enoyl-CoA hydratase n=1 Tax=Labrys monachus TaxID=217067 RepID=A0ABU0FLZ2_9HYPH|nr:enoyl-CoA hydratase [Labrys monachus]MDQ0395615.1 enoyl-CoA hydratase [Labrys monachus]